MNMHISIYLYIYRWVIAWNLSIKKCKLRKNKLNSTTNRRSYSILKSPMPAKHSQSSSKNSNRILSFQYLYIYRYPILIFLDPFELWFCYCYCIFRLYTLWTAASDWVITHGQWLTSSFTSLNADYMTKVIVNSSRIAVRTMKLYKNVKEGPYIVSTQLKNKVFIISISVSVSIKTNIRSNYLLLFYIYPYRLICRLMNSNLLCPWLRNSAILEYDPGIGRT